MISPSSTFCRYREFGRWRRQTAGRSKKHILVGLLTAPCDPQEHMTGPMPEGKGCAAPTNVYTTHLTYPLHHGRSAGGVSGGDFVGKWPQTSHFNRRPGIKASGTPLARRTRLRKLPHKPSIAFLSAVHRIPHIRPLSDNGSANSC